MKARRKICVITGSRSEYGLLRWILKEIKSDSDLELQIVATAMHLSPEFGMTCHQIEDDGFTIDVAIETLLSSDTPVGISKSLGLGLISYAEAFERLRPDLLVLLGDRSEILAAATAALINRIPIAHLHGGELTEGAIDDSIRHSITKMSKIHFTSTEIYRNRVIQLGEHPDTVHCVGAPGLESIRKLDLMSKKQLETDLKFGFDTPTILVTYHPVTLATRPERGAFSELLSALELFPKAKLIFTYPNADTHGRTIIRQIERFKEQQGSRVLVKASLGQLRYLSALQHVDAVIGNSSSALIEAPSLKTPSVDVGIRQKGRIAPETVIQCGETLVEIERAISKAISSEFQSFVKTVTNPYGDGDVARRVLPILKSVKLDELIVKSFYDLKNDT